MKLRKFKKYFGLCEAKGCTAFHDTIVATQYGRRNTFYAARVCCYHAARLIAFPFTE